MPSSSTSMGGVFGAEFADDDEDEELDKELDDDGGAGAAAKGVATAAGASGVSEGCAPESSATRLSKPGGASATTCG
jgi:hypothetical protein